MALLSGLVYRIRWHRRLHELAEEIVERAIEPMWERVADRVLGMSLPESRGYIKTLATAEIRQQAAILLRFLELPGHWQPQLAALASEALAARVAQRADSIRNSPAISRRAA